MLSAILLICIASLGINFMVLIKQRTIIREELKRFFEE